mgnify:FL=1
MPFLNYTNRINIICNDEHNSDIRVYASSQNNHYYVFQENLERVKKEVKKNFPEIKFSDIKIFVEAYRDAYRKEVQWGDLENPLTDRIDFFKKKVLIAENMNRTLDEIDSSTARFRIIMVSGEKNIATSEGFRPFVVKTKEEIQKQQVPVKSSLIGTYEKEMEELFYCDFHNEEPNLGQPVIYLNKKLGIKSDMNSDLRIRTLIFSKCFKELLKESIILPDNEYKKKLLKYAQTHNDQKKWEDISELYQNSNVSANEFYENLELDEFIDNATQGYISEKDFLEKYLEDKNRSDIENNLTGEELDEA